jgi:DNA-binding NarL/FixJ family response regulator
MPTVFAIHAQAGTHLLVSRAVDMLARTELAGSSSSAVEAARVIDTLAPDAVTLDARLPDGDGIELAERLHADHRGIGVVLFGPADDRRLLRAVAAGVSAYLPAATEVGQTVAAIRGCLAGRGSFSARSLNGALRRDPSSTLSRRELEVVDLIRAGLGQGQIADRLHISESTVKTYVARVRAKGGMATPASRGAANRAPAGLSHPAKADRLNARRQPGS